MEDNRTEVPKLAESKLLFPSHRRLSETYRTLVRILSPFCENTNVSLATEFDPQHLRAAYSGHMKQATVESSCQQVVEDYVRVETGDSAIEKLAVVEDGLGISTLEDRRLHDSEVKMNFIEDIPIVDRSDNVSDQKKTFESRSANNHCDHEGNHRNEVEAEHIVEGNKVLVDDNSCSNMRTSNQTNGGNDQISPKKFPEEIVEHPQVMEEEDAASIVQKLSGTVLSPDDHMIEEASKQEDNQENILSTIDKDTQRSFENCSKELKSESIICKSDLEMERSYVSSIEAMEVNDKEQCTVNPSGADPSYMDKEIPCGAHAQSKNGKDKAITVVENKMLPEAMKVDKYMIENGDIEEGEICGEANEISEDPVVLTEKVVGIQISEERMNTSKLPLIQANGEANKPVSLFFDKAVCASHENREESISKQNKSSVDACKYRSIASEKMATSTNEDQNDFTLEERGYTGKDGVTKKDVDSFTVRFSNHVLCSQVVKEHATGREEIISIEKETGACKKKKRGPPSEGRKERKKIQKRKKRAEKNRKDGVKRLKLHTVTVPKPVVYCRHYIKGRCQEGDKCKFSHDTTPLTKSRPCSYFARHSCMKGGDCPFDHQLSKYPCSNFVSNGSCPRGDTCMFSHKILPQESTSLPNLRTESKPPVTPDSLDTQKQLNISGCLKQNLVTVPNYTETSCNRTPLAVTPLKKMTGPPPVGINFLSFGKSPDSSSQMKNDNVECKNVLAQSGLCSVENSNETSRIQPNTVVPKGINFLSLGKTSQLANRGKLAAPSSYSVDTIPSGNQIQAVSKTGHDANEHLKKVQMTTPKQTNFLSPIGNYVSKELVSSSSNSKVGSDLFVHNKGSVYGEHESGLSAVLSRPQGTPISSGQFSDSLASSSMTKGTTNSAQKAVLATLAFAAKHDSFMNKGKSSVFPDLGNKGNKERGNENIRGSLKNDESKASKLLDFLLGIGSKSNL